MSFFEIQSRWHAIYWKLCINTSGQYPLLNFLVSQIIFVASRFWRISRHIRMRIHIAASITLGHEDLHLFI